MIWTAMEYSSKMGAAVGYSCPETEVRTVLRPHFCELRIRKDPRNL